ncbi:MAG: leucyl aminopeptidase [Tissierellia bacterium]|nr:leucyl aminopeptidase [Tissierellia bacterium]
MNFVKKLDSAPSLYFLPENKEPDFFSEDLKNYIFKERAFEGKAKESLVYIGPKTDNIILVGLGKEEDLEADTYVQAGYRAYKLAQENKLEGLNLSVEAFGDIHPAKALQDTVEGLYQGAYHFDSYLKEKKERRLKEVHIHSELEDQEALIQEVSHLMEAVYAARDFVNAPANDLYPESFAQRVLDLFKDLDVDIRVYDEKEVKDMGMEALLAVGKGSDRPVRFLVAKYLPLGEDQEAITLVGKGMTYDSGGYALKPARSMDTMKSDMAGAATAVASLYALAKNQVQENVVAIFAAAENMVSGGAVRNGDIIGSMKGSTIEVNNTDAEGRLILADALYYAASQVNSKAIIDMATLTGAAIAALGYDITAALTNDQELLDGLLATSRATGEGMWQLPITPGIREKTKSKVADLDNSSRTYRVAGTIYAAAFLEHFVEGKPWIHLDIAGPAYKDSPSGYLPYGATGVPVKTLYHYIKKQK